MCINPRAGWPGAYQMRRKGGFSWPRTSKYLQPSNVFILKCIFDLSKEPVPTDKVLSSCCIQVFWRVELFGFEWHARVFYRTSFREERVNKIKISIWSFMPVNAEKGTLLWPGSPYIPLRSPFKREQPEFIYCSKSLKKTVQLLIFPIKHLPKLKR